MTGGPPSLSIDPFAEDFLADPYAVHPILRDEGPVVWLEKYGCYGMARHAEVKQALNDHQTFVSGRGVGLSDFLTEAPWRPPSLLLEADPPLHDRTRGLMNKIVALAGLKERAGDWSEIAEELVQALPQEFDAVEAIAEAFPLRIFPDLIGLREEGRENLIPYATTVFNAFGPRNRILEESMRDAGDSTAWVAESCQREKLCGDGWGAKVFEAADRGECTEAEAERLVRSFLSAGVDTTVNGIANLIYCLAANPDQYQMLRADRRLLKKAIEESLRWGGIVQTFFRTTARDVKIGGENIPEGSKVLLFLAAANRDPRHWANPEQFDVNRAASGHVGFGFGIHQCLGQMVARMEMEAVLRALLDRFVDIRLSAQPARRINNTLFAIARLPVRVQLGDVHALGRAG